MNPALNLSRRPFRNERLPTLLLSVAGVLLAAATVRHAVVAWDLLPGRARDVESQVTALEAESKRLSAEAAELQRFAASSDQLGEWSALKGLVDRRTFSWTGLFGALEKGLPPGVRLTSVTPHADGAGADIDLSAVGRGGEDALALLKALKTRDEFDAAFLSAWDEGADGTTISCTVRYVPGTNRRAGR